MTNQTALESAILNYLANDGIDRLGMADRPARLSEIAIAVGVKAGKGSNPMSSPLNQALARLRDAGKIVATDGQFGEPRFTLVTVEVTGGAGKIASLGTPKHQANPLDLAHCRFCGISM
jgi:hypothetical protein